MKVIRKLMAIAMLFLPVSAFAGWHGPEKVLEGTWGKAVGQFGIFHGDDFDYFPEEFLIDNNNKILILDVINGRLQIYDNVNFTIVTPRELPEKFTDEEWPYKDKLVALGDKIIETRHDQIYDYQGNLIGRYDVGGKYFKGLDRNENLFFEDISTKIYYKYSQNGEILSTYNQRPLELGREIFSGSTSDGLYQQIIEFDDAKFTIKTKGGISSYVRDANGFFYGTGDIQGTSYPYYRVYKFGPCSKQIASLDLPENIIHQESDGIGDAPVDFVTVEEEYGPPVIGPDGSVYCWKRTPDTYSILKWTWVDSTDDPKPGPDAPTNLKLTPSLDGLYLTWGASPQDPGCVDGYELERATTADGIYTTMTTTDPGVLKFNDTGALSGTTYFYKVRAKGGGEYSPYSMEVSGKRIQ